MSDFHLIVNKNQIAVRKINTITSGSVNVYTVKFDFSDEWNDLEKVATFKSGTESYSIVLDESNICIIPWESIKEANLTLKVGVCGMKDSDIVLPTIWARLGTILPGAGIGSNAHPPTPDVLEQILGSIPLPMSAEELRQILIDGGTDNG